MDKDNEVFAAECEQSTNTGEDSHNSPKKDDGRQQQSTSQSGHQVKVFDYEVSGDNDRGAGQEMQEKEGSRLLGSTGNTANPAVSRALDDDMEWNVEDEPHHVENARPPLCTSDE